ncbi:hypothetical protein GCM10027594_07860 [Hymenobacter agri]
MSAYDFENLDDKKFEQLANALCAEYVARGTSIFGSGTDGGREATYQGKMKYPLDEEPWDGYLVVQCKQKERLSGSLKTDADWAIAQLDAEMDMYQSAVVPRKRPEYFLFITNVELSAKLNTGGKDRFKRRLAHWVKELKMKGADVWDRDKLGNLLDTNRQIAEGFGFLHAGDVLHRAAVALGAPTNIRDALYVFLHKEIRNDQYVNLMQAGHTADEQPPLARVFVDLRATTMGVNNRMKDVQVVEAVQQVSDRPIAPSDLKRQEAAETEGSKENSDELHVASAKSQALSPMQLNPSRFVFIGGPGQGKSTLAQYLSQRHRAALLLSGQFNTCEPDVEAIALGVKQTAVSASIGLPLHPRVPFRIVLEQLASALANREVASVLDYVAATVRTKSGMPFARRDAEQLLATTPLLIAFDGLDEVPAVSNRTQVLDVVQNFLDEARNKDADVLVIATTRPQGFNGEFAPDKYNHMTLLPLTRDEALVYARKLVDAKYAMRPERRELVMERLAKAAEDDAIARLMESPLQVTIMAVLVEIVGNLPRERFMLFQRYYDIIYQREQERGLKLSDILVTHRQSIEVIHDRIGLKLQIEAETEADAENKTVKQGRISRDELRELVYNYLVSVGFEEPEVSGTTDEFMAITLDRLVFMVQAEQDSYGFEVRSLQEFSAARALMRGDYLTVKERLRAVATIPYWLNTVLFAVGRAFSLQDDQQCDIIVQLCNELNDDDNVPILYHTQAGARLALEILEDGVGESRPKYRRMLLGTALQLVNLPHHLTAIRLVGLYSSMHDERYRMAAQAAIGVHNSDDKLGLFTVLVELAKRKDEAEWAKEMLHQLWPKKAAAARYLLERLVAQFTWEPWQVSMVQEVAGQSGIHWVDTNLVGKTPIRWIKSAQELEHGNERKIQLANEDRDFSFNYRVRTLSEKDLKRIAKAQPVNMDWLPLVVCRSFLLQPSAQTLADGLEALAQHKAYDPGFRGHYYLPWQLVWILNGVSSTQELLDYASRARQGQFGSTAEWKAAETRWEKEGVTVADFRVFTNEEWPFTAEIGQRGIQPFNAIAVTTTSAPHSVSEADLLEAFATTTTTRARPVLANAFFFVRRVTTRRRTDPTMNLLTLPVATVVELAQSATRSVTAPTLLSLLEEDIDWVSAVNELDAMGRRITWLGEWDYHLLAGRNIRELIDRFVSFLPGKPIREGLLRFIASVGVLGRNNAAIHSLPVDFERLSEQGQVDYVAIVLQAEIDIPIQELLQLVLRLWNVRGIPARFAEIPNLLRDMLEQRKYTAYHKPLLVELLKQPEVDPDIKEQIVDKFIAETQLNVSGLEEPETRKQLKIEF